VARGIDGRDIDRADGHHLAVSDGNDVPYGGETAVVRILEVLRIVLLQASRNERPAAGLARVHRRARQPLQGGQAAGVIVVRMRDEDGLDVFRIEADNRVDVVLEQHRDSGPGHAELIE